MGYKRRGNFTVGICLKLDCVNQETDICKKCIHFSLYERWSDKEEDAPTDK